ncbi:MAG: response regulator [Candidatus Omnitrophota bacterium]|nr:response regulator [Candidatus Omnitrophota bacterium]
MAKKILIVEDEPDLLTLAQERLKAAGYDILSTTSSEETLKLLKTEMPDLILLDLLLPEMQGDVLCKKLKSDPHFKHIPIIIFTASIIRVPERIKEMGADDYILKPFEPADLLEKIRMFIR